jgi:hypothetical protein
MPLLDYLPSIVAFLAALAAIVGAPKWDPSKRGLQRLNTAGRVTLVVAAGAFVASVLTTWRSQPLHRAQMIAAAHTELRVALKMLTEPFADAFYHDSPPGYVDASGDIGPLDLAPPAVFDSRWRTAIAQLDLKQKIALDDAGRARWQVFQDAATSSAARIDRVLQLYGTYFDPEVLTLVLQLQSSEFLEMRLKRLGEFVHDNEFIDRPIPFVYVDPREGGDGHGDRFGYESFWSIIKQLDTKLEKHETLFHRTFHEVVHPGR